MAVNSFDWDERKASTNHRKHGVSFERAAQVFDDPRALTAFDPGHSGAEERWYTMGLDHAGQLLVVHHCYRKATGAHAVIRLISSRRATAKEKAQYLGKKR